MTSAVLAITLVSTPVMATTVSDSAFTALEDVQVQSLTAAEMQAITGELNAFDIAAALNTLAAKTSNQQLGAFFTKLANATLANAAAINTKLDRLHLLTPCHSCAK